MFTIPTTKILFVKENGLYDYLLDLEEKGEINSDDKDTIYQYLLAYSVLHMSDKEYSEFVDGLASTLWDKKSIEMKEEEK